MKTKLIATAAIAAGLSIGAAGSASAAPGGGSSCSALNEAHKTVIAAQGLERHLTLGVHTKAFTKLLANCA